MVTDLSQLRKEAKEKFPNTHPAELMVQVDFTLVPYKAKVCLTSEFEAIVEEAGRLQESTLNKHDERHIMAKSGICACPERTAIWGVFRKCAQIHQRAMGDQSAVSRLLLTNQPPLDTEAQTLRENELSNAEKELELIDVERKNFQTAIDQLKAVLSPVRRVPPEIWAEIFRLNPEYCSVFDTKSKAWSLSQVSRLFRATAASCPELWSDMHLWSFKTSLPDDALLTLARTALQRAGPGPIDLRFWVHESIEPELLKIFLPRAISWRKLEFSYWSTTLEPLVHVQHQLANLQSVKFSSCESSISTAEWKDVFRHCPKLCEVSGPSSILHGIALPWSRITHCILEQIDNTDYIDFLLLAPNLQTFGVDEMSFHEVVYHPPTREHTTVRKLVAPNGAMLDQLTLPNLEDLLLTSLSSPEYIVRSLYSFIIRSECLLQRLRIEAHHFDENFLEILDSIPTLRDLELYSSYFTTEDFNTTKELFRHLTIAEDETEDSDSDDEQNESFDDSDSDDEDVCLPKLEKFDLHISISLVSESWYGWDDELVKMAESRRRTKLPKGVVQLEELNLLREEREPLIDKRGMARLQALQTGGLMLKVADPFI
ncbi:hypothetical protein C8J56DRAFT_1105630 [Mycena floridula]|nr:hypothetical protein C8J56DRAFT_1105630 [Mycena floridula]